ncbi:MAG: L,D-transpeptidase [Parachlamydiales bacterium]
MGRILTLVGILFVGVIGLLALLRHEPKAQEERPIEITVGAQNIPPQAELAAAVEVSPYPEFVPMSRMEEFFNVGLPKLPVVETVTYSSRAPFVEGRPAWIADYASHYKTSRHFIARSLNRGPNYERQEVSNGAKFNVLKADKPISFHLVVDTSDCTLSLYYLDEERGERTLVKRCKVGLGRPDGKRASGMLTPWGSYSLGEKIAVYRPGAMGQYNRDKVEMIQVFGTRWIPFDQEIGECTEPAQGFGIHGCPWVLNEAGELVEDTSGLGRYESDGCIRLRTEDMEEIFAVIITRPSTLYLVPHKEEAKLPGTEVVS